MTESVGPHGLPPGSSVHSILQGKNIGMACHYPPPGNLLNSGIEPMAFSVSSALQADSLPLSHLGSPEEISSLSHSIVFLYFFALITEEGFLISPCYSLELGTEMSISFLSFLPFASLLFSAICNASSSNHFAFLHFFFLGMVLIPVSCTMLETSVHSSSDALSDLIP